MQISHRMVSPRMGIIAIAMLLVAMGIAIAGLAENAWAAQADDIGVYTASVSATYENPDTGAIEDSGGEGNKALGQSMVAGIVQPDALVEKDGSGAAIVTMRFFEASELGEIRVSFDEAHSGSFAGETGAQLVRQDADANMDDYRFTAPSEDATLRFDMYVTPMGRNVVFFVKLANIAEGNTAGFDQSIDVEGLKAAAERSSASASASAASSSSASPSSASAGSSNANNNVSTEGGPDIGMIIVIAVLAIVVIGVIAVLVSRSRRK